MTYSVHQTTIPPLDLEIETLLSLDASTSIVDSLFGLPDEEKLEAEAGMFGRAVHDRLQARIAEKMRRTIDPVSEGKPAKRSGAAPER